MGTSHGNQRADVRTPIISGACYVAHTPMQTVLLAPSVHPASEVKHSKPTTPEESAVTDPAFINATINTLHRINLQGDASQIPSIAALLGQGKGAPFRSIQHPDIRIAAVEALRALVPTFPGSWSGLSEVLELLRITSLTDGNEAVRCASLRVLREVGQRGDDRSIAICKYVLEDCKASADLRIQTVDTLQALVVRGDVCSMNAALVALKDLDCAVRSGGLNILRRICAPCEEKTMEFLQDLAVVATRHKEVEARAGAIELISQMEKEGGGFGIKVATMCLHDIRGEVQQQALVALRRIWRKGDPEAVNILVSLLKSSQDAELRCLAFDVLADVANRGDMVAISTSIQILEDPDSSVQAAATQALKQLCVRGNAKVVDALLTHLSHGEAEVQRQAIEVLAVAAMARNTQVVAALQKLCNGSDPGLQLAAEQALRQMR